jgi:hypothetical protein
MMTLPLSRSTAPRQFCSISSACTRQCETNPKLLYFQQSFANVEPTRALPVFRHYQTNPKTLCPQQQKPDVNATE